MTKLGKTLRALLDASPRGRGIALVGGLAVSARTQPRFTRDVDFAIAVNNDTLEWNRAQQAVALIQQRGFSRGRDLAAGLAEVRSLSDL